MKIRVFAYLILFLALLGQASCKKNEATNDGHGQSSCSTQTIYITSEIAKFKFKKNTYWVYVDSVNLQTDSTYIDSVTYGTYQSSKCSLRTVEVYSYETSPQNPYLGRKDSYVLANFAFFRDETFENDYDNDIYVDNSNGSIGMPVIDSLFVYDRFYKKVGTRTCLNDVREGGYKCVYYSNSDFGILRKDVFYSNGTLKSKKLLKSKLILR